MYSVQSKVTITLAFILLAGALVLKRKSLLATSILLYAIVVIVA
jgi:hypothetical protein